MPKVTVYRVKILNPILGDETMARRWFTREGADMIKATAVLENTAVEIDDKDLDRGNQWTAIDYVPAS